MPVKGTPSYYTNALSDKRAVVLYSNQSTYDLLQNGKILKYSSTNKFTQLRGGQRARGI
jgi:hypothetical protein